MLTPELLDYSGFLFFKVSVVCENMKKQGINHRAGRILKYDRWKDEETERRRDIMTKRLIDGEIV